MYLVTQIVHLFIPVFICAYMLSANIEYYVPHIQYTKEFKVKPLSSRHSQWNETVATR